MNPDWELLRQQPLIILPLGVAVVAALAWRGFLSPRALAAGPNRAIGLGVADLVAGLGLLMVLQLVAAAVLRPMVGSIEEAPPRVAVTAVVLAQLIVQVPPILYLAWRASRRPRGLLRIGLLPRSPGRELLLGSGAFFITLPIVFSLMVLGAIAAILLGQPLPELAHSLLRVLVSPEASIPTRVVLVLSAVVLGPALEEGFYRGLLQSATVELLGGRRGLAVFAVSGMFAMMHLGATPWHALPALFGLSVILGWLYERTGSLWPSILLHTLFNAFNVALALLTGPAVDAPVTV